jgi:mono/diheme cytochrome c family protein
MRHALGTILLATLVAGSAQAGPLSADAPALTPDQVKALKNPIPNTAKSISRGRVLFATSGCTACHGNDGKALIEVVANATDLTSPDVWKNGTAEGQTFHSIRDGAGVAMPPFKGQLTEEDDLWNLVNFIRSLWPEGKKPPVVEG